MMSTILVTGASGQLGSEIRERSVRYSGYNFVFTDTGELDITDAKATASFIAELSPSWIINCAAFTAVDKAEDEEETATLINAGGVEISSAPLRDQNAGSYTFPLIMSLTEHLLFPILRMTLPHLTRHTGAASLQERKQPWNGHRR